jgi:hypothetical protein
LQWPLVLLLLVSVYSLTAKWTISEQNVDTIAATLPAWHLITEGDLDLSEYAGANPWIVETPNGYWTNRPPGLVAFAVVAHGAALPFTESFSGIPGTLTAVLLAAAAVTLVAIECARLYGSRTGYLAVIALGFASATWPQASSELFPHAVGQFLLALTVRHLARDRLWLAGVFLGLAITVRPPIAMAALALGVGLAWTRRRIEPTFSIGAPSAAGLGVVVLHNRLVFGTFSVSGGYGSFVESGSQYRTPGGYLTNLLGTFFDGSNGLLVWSPWILVTLLFIMIRRTEIAADWARAAALAGLAYLLLHTGLNRFWGGLAFNYRYALEPLVLAMPLLSSGLSAILTKRIWRLAFLTALGVSIVMQGAVALLLTCVDQGGVATCSLL